MSDLWGFWVVFFFGQACERSLSSGLAGRPGLASSPSVEGTKYVRPVLLFFCQACERSEGSLKSKKSREASATALPNLHPNKCMGTSVNMRQYLL